MISEKETTQESVELIALYSSTSFSIKLQEIFNYEISNMLLFFIIFETNYK